MYYLPKLICRKVDCKDKCWTTHDLDASCYTWSDNLCQCRKGNQWFKMTLEEMAKTEGMDECNCAENTEIACACSHQFVMDVEKAICIPE